MKGMIWCVLLPTMIYKNPKYYLPVILFLGLTLPLYGAYAGSFGIESIGYAAINGFFAFSLSIMFSAVGKLLGIMVVLLSWVVNLRVYSNTPIIEEGWKIMRDFANMLFIVALIVMAYGTIFNIKGYDFKSLIPKFLIAALLINFSLVIGTLVIDGTQILNNTFLLAMGDISGRLGDGLNPAQILPEGVGDIGDTEAIANAVTASILTLIFSIFLLFTFLVSVAVPMVIAFVRIPILWALLIVSPMAWLLNILPATQGVYKTWWKHFLAWNLFLPYYLFFMYFALYFLSKKNEVLAGLGQDFVYSQLNGLQSNFTFGLLFYYVMVAIFMIGGTKVAMSAGTFSGTGIVSVAKWGRGMAMRRLGVTAAGRAAKGRYEEYKEGREGALKRQEAFFRTGFGRITGGRTDAQDRQLAADVQKNKDKFANNTDAQLAAQMSKGRKDERLAAAEIMNQRGLLNSAQLQQVYALYGANTLAGKQFARSLNYDKMTQKEREDWLGKVPDIETIKKILQAMADKGDDYIKNEGNLNRALELFKLEGDQRDLLKKIEKHELEIATKISMEKGFIKERDASGNMKDIREIYRDPIEALDRSMRQVVSRMNPDALLEATRTLTKDDRMRDIAKGALNMQKIEAMMAKGTEQQLDAWKRADDRFDSEKIKAEKERVARELAEVTGRATGEAITRAGGLGGSGQPQPQQPPSGTPPAVPRRPAGFVRPGETAQQGNIVDLRNKNNQ